MKIITLIENLVYNMGLTAEHGLSFYIDTGFHKIIIDTGHTENFLANAKKMQISIKEIDAVILSHGHADHTGGLYAFLKENIKAKVYVKKEIFVPKFKRNSTFIGIEYNATLLNERICYIEKPIQVFPNIYIMPNITIYNDLDTNFDKFQIRKRNSLVSDNFEDELYVILLFDSKLNIITSCSHRGITNICQSAIDYFQQPVNMVLGGFHIKESSAKQIDFIINYFNLIHPNYIGTCHCTGIDKFAILKNKCTAKVFYNFTGNELNFTKQK